MSAPDASAGEMPTVPRSRSGGPPSEAAVLERLLDGSPPVRGVPARFAELAAVLSAARGPATPAELAGQTEATRLFLDHGVPARRPLRRAWERVYRRVAALAPARILVAAGVAAASVTGLAAAAYADALPPALQSIAHVVIGAPPAHSGHAPSQNSATTSGGSGPVGVAGLASGVPSTAPSANPSPRPVGPSTFALSPSGGLCTAWRQGGIAADPVAYQALVKAAGSAAAIPGYCGAPLPRPTGRPSAAGSTPTGSTPAHPVWAPSPQPTASARQAGTVGSQPAH